MSIDELMTICKVRNGVTTDIKWEDHLCFNVGEKIFLLTTPDLSPPTATFKVSNEDFNALAESYNLVASKLTRKLRTELGIE